MRLAKAWPEGPLVFGHDKQIAEFVRRRIPQMHAPFGECAAIGVIRHNKLIGGIVYHDHSSNFKTISASSAFDRPEWISPAVLGSLFAYPFLQLDCVRITMAIAKKNKRARRFIEGIGFKLEGCARKGYLTDDIMIYGMLKRECRWLEDRINVMV